MNIVERSIQIALDVHREQFDLGGNLYILHPLRVMGSVELATREYKDQYERICAICAAVLHDTVEDATAEKFKYYYKTDSEAREAVSRRIYRETKDRISTVVFALTRQERESWKKYIRRVEFDKLATLIKIYDLKDNLDNTRLEEVTDKDEKRNEMYFRTLKKLEKVYKEF